LVLDSATLVAPVPLGQPLVPILQHKLPATACWTKNNSSAAKATAATVNIVNLAHDRLLNNR
jgi:hypothetical protein